MRVTLHAIYLLLATMLAPTLFAALEVFGVMPNLFLVYIVIAGFYVSKNEAIWLGLIFGLVFDIIVGHAIGLNGILYMFACFLVVLFCENMIRRSNAVVTFLSVAVWTLVLESVSAIFGGNGGFLNSIRIIGIEAVYNGVLSVILYILLGGLFERLSDEKR